VITGRGAGWVDLRWSASGEDSLTGRASGYEVRARADGAIVTEADWAQAAILPLDLPAPPLAGEPILARWEGLEDAWTGVVAVRARDAGGQVSPLGIAAVVPVFIPPPPPPPPDPPEPAPPRDLAVVLVGTRSAVLSLRHPAPVEVGQVLAAYVAALAREPVTLETWSEADTTAAVPALGEPDSLATWTMDGLEPGTTWFVAVRTRDAAGQLSALSTLVTFRTEEEDLSPPVAPGAPEAAWSETAELLIMSWPPSSDARVTGYRVYGEGADGTWRPLGPSIVEGTSCEIPRADLAGLTRVAVRAVIPGGVESPLSGARALFFASWELEGPFPHPVAETCRLRLQVPLDLPAGATVRVEVLDLLGRHEAFVHDGPVVAGTPLLLTWDRTTDSGRAGPGYHYLRVEAPGWRTLRSIYLAP
jgi:hypothetical protein